MQNAYQATLSKETWSQSSKNLKASHVGGGIKASIGARILNVVGIEASAQAKKDSEQSAEQKAVAPYPIVSIAPTGW